jgi:hypothetical protein
MTTIWCKHLGEIVLALTVIVCAAGYHTAPKRPVQDWKRPWRR